LLKKSTDSGHFEISADDARKVHFTAGDIYIDDATSKPVANTLVYEYSADHQHYVLTFRRKNDIFRRKLVDTLHGINGTLARLIGFDGAYLRFTGDAQLDCYDGEHVVESQHGEAIWELMYLGHAPKA
jgi:hypothetical protein